MTGDPHAVHVTAGASVPRGLLRLRRTDDHAGRLLRPAWLSALVPAVLLGALLGRFLVAGSSSAPPAAAPAADRSTEARVATLQSKLRATPDDPRLLADLGVAYLVRARETADPGYFTKAAQALDRSDALAPDQVGTLTARGLLALARHDFSQALDLGARAHALDRAAAAPLGVVVDANVELGRYPEAAAAAQDMVDRRPSLASLARVSYVRELTGDQVGAVTAMTRAVVAGSGSPNDVAYVQTLLGDLRLASGDLEAADGAYTKALATSEGYAAAEVGKARVAAARGDIGGAATRLAPVVERLPNPAWVALLGDLLSASGPGAAADADAQYALVRRIEELNRANGVAVDFEVARFEADHIPGPAGPGGGATQEAVTGPAGPGGGATQEAVTAPTADAVVAMARSALVARPTIFAEDALGWALRQSGRPADALVHARAAVRLGTADALLWWHLARTEADLGMVDEARSHLSAAFSFNPYLSVRDLPGARALAAELALAR